MASSCPPMQRCGTHAPGWLNGSHPLVAEGAVQRQVCFHWSGGCCQWQNNIQVRNCSGYYVYRLKSTGFCSLPYCGSRGGKYQYNYFNLLIVLLLQVIVLLPYTVKSTCKNLHCCFLTPYFVISYVFIHRTFLSVKDSSSAVESS